MLENVGARQLQEDWKLLMQYGQINITINGGVWWHKSKANSTLGTQ